MSALRGVLVTDIVRPGKAWKCRNILAIHPDTWDEWVRDSGEPEPSTLFGVPVMKSSAAPSAGEQGP